MEDDFIANLSTEERLVFLKTMLMMIKIDARVDDRERALAHELMKTYNVSEFNEIFEQMQSKEALLTEIKNVIKERKKALLLLRELLIIVHIDDDFDEKEMIFIGQIAHVLNIDEDLVLELNQLVLDYKLMRLKSKKLMES